MLFGCCASIYVFCLWFCCLGVVLVSCLGDLCCCLDVIFVVLGTLDFICVLWVIICVFGFCLWVRLYAFITLH